MSAQLGFQTVGQVTRGMNVVREIENARADKNDRPLEDICIISVSMQLANDSVPDQ
jgi:cyclophilin family peptidyl-prolyl cis-trans isomerase